MRGWTGWRTRQVWAVLAGAVLIAGTIPVILVVAGDDAQPALFHLPRPGALGAPESLTTDPPGQGQAPGGGTVGVGQTLGNQHGTKAPEYAPSTVVVKLRDPGDTTAVTSRGGTVVGEIAGTGFVEVHTSGDPAALVAELRRDPAVATASLDYGRRTTATPNDTYYGFYQSAYLSLVRMPAAWDLLTNASSQVVAVIDTGVDASHPDLAGRLVAGYNAVSPGSPPSDEEGHGTFVAGVVAANANNGNGIAGVTWNGRVMPIKVFTGDLAFDSDTAAGIVWAVDHGARVINLSLGGPGSSPLLAAAIDYATGRNVVVVASAGNDGNDVEQYPAAFPDVIAVGATDSAGRLVDFSSYGPWVDLAAPGFEIVSTFPGNDYAIGDGTSFSAPIVAGVAAMIRAQNPALTWAQVGDRLRAAARDAGPRGFDPYYGFGVLDAARALGAPFAADLPLSALGGGEPNDVPERATPITISSTTNGTIAVEGDADWFRLDSPSAQTVTVSVNTPSFDPGIGQNLDSVLEVYNADLGRIAFADSLDPAADESTTVDIQAGTTYVRVRNYNGAADSRSYTLSVASGTGPPPYDLDNVFTGTHPNSLVIGDVTGDGLSDLVYATEFRFTDNPDDNKIFVRAQQPDGSLGTPIPHEPTSVVVRTLALADVDQDERLDVVAGGGSGLEWFRQDEAGGLVSQGLLDNVASMSYVMAADLDDDGDTDLVERGSGSPVVLIHGEGATFVRSPIGVAGIGGFEFAIGDLDGTGELDLGAAGAVWHNGPGGWAITGYPVVGLNGWNTPSSVDVGDVTGDGRDDIIVTTLANAPNAAAIVIAQNPDGSLAAGVPYAAGNLPQSIKAGDLDGDGRLDVAMINNSFGSVTVFYQQPDGTLGKRQIIGSAFVQHPGGQGLAIGDLNGDGLADIASIGDTSLGILYRTGGGPGPSDAVEAVRSVSPVEYATDVALAAAPQVVLASQVDPSTVNTSTVRLIDGRTATTIPATVSFDAGTHTATITPDTPLDRATPYRILVDGIDTTDALPTNPFTSTFVTTTSGGLPALRDFAVRGQVGTAAAVTATIPIGDLAEVIVRYSPGTTPPATPTAGTAGYTGVGGGIMIGNLTPGQTYSFAVWYRDRAGNLSPRSSATLTGTTLTLTGTSASPGAGTSQITFTGTVTTPTGPGAGVPVTLTASCAAGPFNGTPVATTTGTATGTITATITIAAPQCSYRWEITNNTQYMGATTNATRITGGPNLPPGQPPPTRDH